MSEDNFSLSKSEVCRHQVGAERAVNKAAKRLEGLTKIAHPGKRVALAFNILADLVKEKEEAFNN